MSSVPQSWCSDFSRNYQAQVGDFKKESLFKECPRCHCRCLEHCYFLPEGHGPLSADLSLVYIPHSPFQTLVHMAVGMSINKWKSHCITFPFQLNKVQALYQAL